MVKKMKSRGSRRISKRVYQIGQAIKVATQYDGTILAEIVEIDCHILVVRGQNGKTYRILSAEIV